MSWPRFSLLVFLLAFGTFHTMVNATAVPDYQQLSFSLAPGENNHGVDRILARDFNGDGLPDLLVARQAELAVYWQRTEGAAFDLTEPDAQLTLAGNATGWSLDTLAAVPRVLALVDASTIKAWPLTAKGFGEPKTLAAGLAGSLPTGVQYLPFVQDVNGDGRSDLIVPAQEQLYLLLQQADGVFAKPLSVQAPVNQRTRLQAPENLRWSVGQAVEIPALDIRDLNSDGKPDLVVETEERLAVFLADPKGQFPSEPSYQLDLQALSEQVGEVDYDKIDYANLSGLLAHTYEFQLADIDDDGIHDLIIREAGRIRLYMGTADGMPMEQPQQLLKSAGNVLGIMLHDEDGDGRLDLWLTRLEDISVANIFLWLAVSGSIDAETFVYRNTGDKFASRPHRKITVSMTFPSLFRSAGMVMDALAPPKHRPWPSVAAKVTAGDKPRDLVVLDNKTLSIYTQVIPAQSARQAMLGVEDYRADQDKYVVDWGERLANPISREVRMAQQQSEREPDRRIALAEDFRQGLPNQELTSHAHLQVLTLNNDNADDFIVLTEGAKGGLHGLLFLSQPVEPD